MQDRPTMLELLAAVRGFLEDDVVPALEGRRRFHALVATNVLAIVERELGGEEAALVEQWTALGRVLGEEGSAPARLVALRDGVRARNETLAGRIRTGEAADAAVRAHVRASVRAKLAVSNPRALGSG